MEDSDLRVSRECIHGDGEVTRRAGCDVAAGTESVETLGARCIVNGQTIYRAEGERKERDATAVLSAG